MTSLMRVSSPSTFGRIDRIPPMDTARFTAVNSSSGSYPNVTEPQSFAFRAFGPTSPESRPASQIFSPTVIATPPRTEERQDRGQPDHEASRRKRSRDMIEDDDFVVLSDSPEALAREAYDRARYREADEGQKFKTEENSSSPSANEDDGSPLNAQGEYPPHGGKMQRSWEARLPISNVSQCALQDIHGSVTPVVSNGEPPKKRVFAQRTKTGCHTCRRRKKKCDEGKPTCMNCTRGNFNCGGYGEKKNVPPATGSNSRGKAQHIEPAQRRETLPAPSYPLTQPPWTEPARSRTEIEDHRKCDPMSPPDRPSWTDRYPGLKPAPERVMPPPSQPPPLDMPRETTRYFNPGFQGARPGALVASPAGLEHDMRTMLGAHGPPPPFDRESYDSEMYSQRRKMVSEQPFLHFTDNQLRQDRKDCQAALHRYNEAFKPFSGDSEEDIMRKFRAVLSPQQRQDNKGAAPFSGHIGYKSLVEAPFKCDYGYNIHLGDDVVIQSGCYMQDPCRIEIGKGTIIGHTVTFQGMSWPQEPASRLGVFTPLQGKPIRIEEECLIGNNVIIMGGVTIGRASIVEDGTIVNQDVLAGIRVGPSTTMEAKGMVKMSKDMPTRDRSGSLRHSQGSGDYPVSAH